MILIVGIAHSYTSAIAKFIRDNGGKLTAEDDNVNSTLPYDKYEDNEVIEWEKNKKKFKNGKFPLKDGIAKAPESCFFLKDIPEDVKIVFCLRNPMDLCHSHKEKYGRGVMQTFNKYISVYDLISNAKQDVYVLMTERILNGSVSEAKRLLRFCEVRPPKEIKFDFYKRKSRNIDYIRYRMMNTFCKILFFTKIIRI